MEGCGTCDCVCLCCAEKLSGMSLAVPEVTQSEVAQKQKLKVVLGSINQVRLTDLTKPTNCFLCVVCEGSGHAGVPPYVNLLRLHASLIMWARTFLPGGP